MKKKPLIIIIVLLLIIGGYALLRYILFTTRDVRPVPKEPLNVRMAIISKLQQMVKDGSDGLYILSVGELGVDIPASTLDAKNVSIEIDTVAYHKLDALKKLPDDVFRFTFKSLHIDGIGIGNLLHKKSLSIGGIYITEPVIEAYHTEQPYNKNKREQADTASLYKRLAPNMHKIEIGKIAIQHGTFTHHVITQKDGQRTFNDISISMADILIDSTTQYATDRFLFAKHASLETKNYSLATADSLYIFKIGTIAIAAEQHQVTISGVAFLPRGGKRQFESRQATRTDMFSLKVDSISLWDMDWWALLNQQKLSSKKAEISNAVVSVYFDRSLPKGGGMKIDNFPQQDLARIPFPFSVPELDVHGLSVVYEEYNPAVSKSGIVTFDNITGQVKNVTNIPDEIKNNGIATFTGNCSFMKHVPMAGHFQFYLPKNKKGAFTGDVQMGLLDNKTVNSFAEPIALVSVKSGQMQKATAHVEGNNFKAHGAVLAGYTDLRVAVLKKDSTNGRLRRKGLIDFAANTFLIKKNNPANGKLRHTDFSMNRGHSDNFFNFVWNAIKSGLLKMIGIPLQMGMK